METDQALLGPGFGRNDCDDESVFEGFFDGFEIHGVGAAWESSVRSLTGFLVESYRSCAIKASLDTGAYLTC